MSLTRVFFVFFFLPASILLYRLTPIKVRNALLLLLSLFFIAWGSPADLILIGLSIVFNYFTALELDELRRAKKVRQKKLVLATGIAANTALLVFFKYFIFLLNSIGIGVHFAVPDVPIGISFFTFSAISCLCDVSNGNEPALKNPVDFALYISFFGKITSGPIVKFRDMAKQIRQRNMTVGSVEGGLKLFIVGLSKKLIIAGSLGKLFHAVKAEDLSSMSVATAWLGALFYSLMLYYDFSGYSDMAIGLGKIFGFSFSKNFDHPYISDSMTDFWRRWHISLGAWFRDYVYIPLGGSRVSKRRNIINLSVVWVLTGLWHGANWTFVVWGLYHLAFNISYAWSYLLRMFGAGGSGLLDSVGKYYLTSGGILLMTAIIGATPLLASLGSRIDKKESTAAQLCVTAFFALLLLGSTAFMISDTVSSFLYAQF